MTVAEMIHEVSGDFGGESRVIQGVQERFRGFRWVSGTFHGCPRGSHGVSTRFMKLQKVSKAYQGCSRGFKENSMTVAGVFHEISGVSEAFQNPGVFQRVSGDFKSVPAVFRGFKGVPYSFSGIQAGFNGVPGVQGMSQ